TGDPRDCSSQLDGYSLAIADRWTGATGVVSEVVFVDLEETQPTSASYDDLFARVLGLYDRWRDKSHSPHQINRYCDSCALLGELSEHGGARQISPAAAINDIAGLIAKPISVSAVPFGVGCSRSGNSTPCRRTLQADADDLSPRGPTVSV